MIHFATNVAHASGGFVGFWKISKQEREAITNVYRVINPEDTLYKKNVKYRVDEMVELLNDHRQTAVDSDYRLKVEYETKVHHKG